MRVHANLRAPRSDELAGRIDERALPAAPAFRNVLVTASALEHSLKAAMILAKCPIIAPRGRVGEIAGA